MNKQFKASILYSIALFTLSYLHVGCNVMGMTTEPSVSNDYIVAQRAYSNKKYDIAKQHYHHVIEKYPHHINALFRLGNISMHEKKWDNATSYYRKVLAVQPTHEKSHHNLAMLHLSLARNHLQSYISHNNTVQNKPLGQLIEAVKRYSEFDPHDKTSIDVIIDNINE